MLNFTVQISVNTEYLQPLKTLKKNRHGEGYFASYYQNNRQSLLEYSKDYYQVRKLLEPYLNKKNTDRHREGYWKTYQRKKGENDRHREGY